MNIKSESKTSNKKLVLKICCSDWKNASRDKRELSLCRELGMNVLVLARGIEEKKEVVDNYEVIRKSSRPFGKYVPTGINRIIALFTWANKTRKIAPDIISGHDIDGLLIGYLSTLFMKKRPKLIYDSHEFELGRNKKRNKFQLWFVKALEGFLIRRCAFSIMVNDQIADKVQNIYHLHQRPVVVRSTPNYWNIDKNITRQIHEDFCTELNVPNNTFFVMYHGALVQGRGIETLITVVSKNVNICGVILGNGNNDYLKQLYELTCQLNVTDRILFKNAVPINDLWKYVGSVDLGVITLPSQYESYRLSLPNKFFENIQSETPIICPDYPAMKAIVEEFDNGITCDVSDINGICQVIEQLRTNPYLLERIKDGTKKAKNELCWEKEKSVLYKHYKILIGQK